MSDLAKRARVEGGAQGNGVHQTVRTPSPSRRAKRTSTDLRDDEEREREQVSDPRGLYYSHRQQIDVWYDEQHPVNRGILQYNKKKHITDPWYVKVDAWMKHKGLVQSPKKKRKLNNGAAVSEPTQDEPPPRPDRIRHPGDKQGVPEYPFDKLSDFGQMPNGHYACGHVNLDPPRNCCINGMTRQAKKQAIKKSVFIWKGRVERLIDAGKLNALHKTWEDWTEPKLRKKYQPDLYEQQERQKEQRKRINREEEERMRQRQTKRKRKAERGSGTLVQGEGAQVLQKRDEPQTSTTPQNLDEATIRNIQETAMGSSPLPSTPRRHENILNGAQAYAVADNSDRRQRSIPTGPQLHRRALWNQRRISQNNFRVPHLQTSSQTVHGRLATSSEHILIDLTADETEPQSFHNIPVEIQDRDDLDDELDRILAPNSSPPVQPDRQRIQSTTRQTTSQRSEVSHITSLPQWCATGNAAVDGEVQCMLGYAYQSERPINENTADDERILCQAIEDGRGDLQRFYDFFTIVSNNRG